MQQKLERQLSTVPTKRRIYTAKDTSATKLESQFSTVPTERRLYIRPETLPQQKLEIQLSTVPTERRIYTAGDTSATKTGDSIIYCTHRKKDIYVFYTKHRFKKMINAYNARISFT